MDNLCIVLNYVVSIFDQVDDLESVFHLPGHFAVGRASLIIPKRVPDAGSRYTETKF